MRDRSAMWGRLRAAVDGFLMVTNRRPPLSMHSVAASVHEMCAAIEACEPFANREELLAELAPAREVHARSPFALRVQTWPRGYPGDFETIELLLAQDVSPEPGTAEYWLEYLALHSSIAQQHRNKILEQANVLADVLVPRGPGPEGGQPSVAILACGGSPDLRMIAERVPGDCQIVLNDADRAAIDFSLEHLPNSVLASVDVCVGDVFSAIRPLRDLGPYDLVVAGGLFDYLPDRAASFLLRSVMRKLLKPGGQFFFTNVTKPNPWRIWPAYLAEWLLIERSPAEVRHLTDSSGATAPPSTWRDPTGLAQFVLCRTDGSTPP